MAGRISNEIVTSGLVLYLDAANPTSYVSGSTTWNDLNGSINNTTLINGPAYSLNNAGTIVLDGVNDYIKTNSTLNLSGTDKITIDVWLKYTGSSVQIISEHSTNFNANNAFLLYINDFGGAGAITFADHTGILYNVSYTSTGSAKYNDNKWHNIAVTVDRSLSATDQTKIYGDGILNTIVDSGLRSDITGNYSTFDLYVGSRAGTSNFYSGSIGNIKMYNRALSSTEVSQNYNALKTRFGL